MASKPLTYRQRRLAATLQRIREEETSHVVEAAAEEIGVATSTLWRVENAKTSINAGNVKALLDFYGVEPARRDALVKYARGAKKQEWWSLAPPNAVPDWFGEYLTLEEDGKTLDVFDPQIVHGLLQTEDYARALFEATPGHSAELIDQSIAVRKTRQERLHNGEIELNAVLDESVLHRTIGGPDVSRTQLERVAEVAGLPNVQLQVLPFDAGLVPVGAFTLVDFPNAAHAQVAYIEHECGAMTMERPNEVRHYRRVFERLRASALSPSATRTRLRKLAKE